MQAKLRNGSNQLLGTITGRNREEITQRARREARKYGLKRWTLVFRRAETLMKQAEAIEHQDITEREIEHAENSGHILR